MPSGAKKRKAAKKKKENQPNNNPNSSSASTHSHGGDEKEEINVVPVEREFKIDDESDKKDGSSSSSSSNSSDDDESHGNKSTPAVVLDKAVILAEAIKSTTVEDASEKAAESVFQGNGEKNPIYVEDKVVISEASKEGASSQQEEFIIQSVEPIAPIPDQKECTAQETDERLTVSYNAPIATTDYGATDPEKDSGFTQPLLAPVPHPVGTTSWKSCCGLFEMFTGSDR